MYRRIEVARTCAKLGDYAAARQGYQNVLQQINHGMSRLEDSEVAQRWKQCAAALREEQELVSACEAECEALRSVGAAPAPAELEVHAALARDVGRCPRCCCGQASCHYHLVPSCCCCCRLP